LFADDIPLAMSRHLQIRDADDRQMCQGWRMPAGCRPAFGARRSGARPQDASTGRLGRAFALVPVGSVVRSACLGQQHVRAMQRICLGRPSGCAAVGLLQVRAFALIPWRGRPAAALRIPGAAAAGCLQGTGVP
jgi:hypothetical protein